LGEARALGLGGGRLLLFLGELALEAVELTLELGDLGGIGRVGLFEVGNASGVGGGFLLGGLGLLIGRRDAGLEGGHSSLEGLGL
jgi:hypothetical protein